MTTNNRFLGTILCTGSFILPATSDCIAAPFDDRASWALEQVASYNFYPGGKHALWYAEARLWENPGDAIALDWIDRANTRPIEGAMFFRHANIDCFLRYREQIPQDLQEKIEEVMLNYNYINGEGKPGGSTHNHHLMYAVAGYLTAQTWPAWSKAERTGNACESWLRGDALRVARQGIWEYDSTTYAVFYLTTWITLRDFAEDPEMRKIAEMMIEWHLVNLAGDWLNGEHVGAHSRGSSGSVGPASASQMTASTWLYFGGPQVNFFNSQAICLAQSSHRPHPIVGSIAHDRGHPHLNREHHSKNFKKMSYLSRSFGLGSASKHTELPWSLKVNSGVVGHRQGIWFSPVTAYGSRDKQKTGRRLQKENILVATYDLSSESNQSLFGNLPPFGDGRPWVRQRRAEGWLFLHCRSALVAIRPSSPFSLSTSSSWGSTLTSEGEHHGLIIEAVEASRFRRASESGLASGKRWDREINRFRDTVLEETVVDFTRVDASRPRVVYTSLDGHVLDITHDGPSTIDGEAFNWEDWPTVHSPFAFSEKDSAILTLNYGNLERVLDFNTLTIEEFNTGGLLEVGYGLEIEAEEAGNQDRFTPFQVGDSGSANAGQFIWVKPGEGPRGNPGGPDSNSSSQAVYPFTLGASPADLSVDLRVHTPNGNDNSFFFQLDDGPWETVQFPSNTTFSWSSARLKLERAQPGGHTLRVAHREDGSKLDTIRVNALAATVEPGQAVTFEAEGAEAQSRFAPFVVKPDRSASGNEYVVWPNGSRASESQEGVLSFPFRTDARAGSVEVDFTVLTPNGQDNSFFVQVDDGTWQTVQFPSKSSWQTVAKSLGGSIPRGGHTLRIRRRETGACLDAIRIRISG